MAEGMRLQKVLAERGVASRRGSVAIIAAGRVMVNGAVVTKPGKRVTPGRDRVEVDGVALPEAIERTRTILLYKPRGYICSRPAGQGKTVYELLEGVAERVVPAGRLDKDSEGLLLLSNDGALIAHLTHPRFGQEKEYRVTVSGSLSPEVLKELERPIDVEGYKTIPARVTILKRKPRPVIEFVLREGRNRQVRRLCERSGLRVHRLVRTRMGELTLKGLKPGRWRDVRERV